MPFPPEVLASVRMMEEDPTVMQIMNGPDEFEIKGSLKGWSIVERASRIAVPTLLLNGKYDQAQDEVVAPFFREVQKVRWVKFEESAHMPHVEEKERCMRVVGEFLEGGSKWLL